MPKIYATWSDFIIDVLGNVAFSQVVANPNTENITKRDYIKDILSARFENSEYGFVAQNHLNIAISCLGFSHLCNW